MSSDWLVFVRFFLKVGARDLDDRTDVGAADVVFTTILGEICAKGCRGYWRTSAALVKGRVNAAVAV